MSSSQRNWRCSATDKAANYLGLMRKAGRIALGEYDAGAAARAGQACLVLLAQQGLGPDQVLAELDRRFGLSGIVEKASRT